MKNKILFGAMFLSLCTLSMRAYAQLEVKSTGDVKASQNLEVVNNSTVGNNLTVANDATVGNNQTISNNLTIGHDLTVNNNVTVNNVLEVSDTLTAGSYLNVVKSVDIAKNLNVSNKVQIAKCVAIGTASDTSAALKIEKIVPLPAGGNNTVPPYYGIKSHVSTTTGMPTRASYAVYGSASVNSSSISPTYYGFSDSNIPNVLQILNNDFNQLSIYFDYAGVDFINNTSFHDMTNLDNSPLINSVINTFVHSNAIDIYLFPTVADIEGYSSGIPGRAIALMGHQGAYMYSDSHLISHEMGHCLGLLHTFHGGVDEAGPCAELVDGSNSDVCGDFVSDTPADPFRLNNYVDDLCFWNNNTVRDANGQLYKPDTRQIMAYVPIRCMQNLTFGQGDRMRATIATCQLLQDRLTSSVVYVQNQQFAGNGEEIVMAYDSVKAGNNVTNAVAGDVIIPAGGNVTFEAGQRIVLKPGFIVNSGAKFKAKISNIRTANYTSKRKNCDYIPLLHNTSWTTISRYFESPMMASVYQCIGDTLICEKNHKIIKQTVINLSDSTIIPDVNPNITTQCLYEDIEHQRVYQYSDYYKRDILLYDFSIQIGERMPSDSLGSSADSLYILKDIELVENSGYARKEYTFVYGTDTIVWLEGIGNITNFTIPHARKNLEHSRILCVRNGDETVYDTDAFYDYTCESIKHIYEDPSHEDFSRPVGNDYRAAKLLRNNQILILRGDHTYTITGQEVIMP